MPERKKRESAPWALLVQSVQTTTPSQWSLAKFNDPHATLASAMKEIAHIAEEGKRYRPVKLGGLVQLREVTTKKLVVAKEVPQ